MFTPDNYTRSIHPYRNPLVSTALFVTVLSSRVSRVGWVDWNTDVLRSWRNCSSDGAERTDSGTAFDARAAATGKAQSPSMMRCVEHFEDADVNLCQQSGDGSQRGMMAPCR